MGLLNALQRSSIKTVNNGKENKKHIKRVKRAWATTGYNN